jgi:hypothetical protein
LVEERVVVVGHVVVVERVAAEASVVDRSFGLLTCPHQVGPRWVNVSQTDSRRRVHPPGF